MFLGEIKIVDLRHSTIDHDKSNVAEGVFEFTDKQYVEYHVKIRRPEWYFRWVRYNPTDGLKDVRNHRVKWGFSYVTQDDPFWPEGIPLTEGKYIFGDAVLMKCKLLAELKRREEAKKFSDAMSMSAYRKFQSEAGAAGIALSHADEDYLDKLTQEFMSK